MKKMTGMLVITLLSHMMVCSAQDDQQTTVEVVKPNAQAVLLSIEEAQRIVEAWDRFELQLRASREDTSGDLAAQGCCPDNTDLAMIRACICAIKNQLCALTDIVIDISGQIGQCTDLVIPEITEAACVTQDDINAICATLQSWVKTIISELRGNQDVCPPV